MYSLCVLSLILCVGLANSIKFKDCGSKTGQIKTVDVSGCTKLPCPLKRGTVVKVAVDFVANVDTKKLTAVVHGKIGPVKVPFNIPNADGCKSNCKCPVTKGNENVYKNQIAISKGYPKLDVIVQWELKDDNNDDVFCFMIPAEITD